MEPIPNELNTSTTPEMNDTSTAVRTASLVVFIAALWFFVSPWAYYGVSDRRTAWNAWLVGAVMVIIAAARLWWPLSTRNASWVNMVLGVWVFICPWVYGYAGYTGHSINSWAVGVLVFALSIVSARNMLGSGL